MNHRLTKKKLNDEKNIQIQKKELYNVYIDKTIKFCLILSPCVCDIFSYTMEFVCFCDNAVYRKSDAIYERDSKKKRRQTIFKWEK